MQKKVSTLLESNINSNLKPKISIRGPVDHEVRVQIIRAAELYFRRFGYEKTTVSELARHLGFSKAYIYKFFISKQAIGEEIASSCIDKIIDSARINIEKENAADDRLIKLITTVTNDTKHLLFEEKKLYDIVTCAVLENWNCHQRLSFFIKNTIGEILKEGQDTGFFDKNLSLNVVSGSIYLSLQSFLNPVMLEHAQNQDPRQVIDLILNGIKP